MLQILKQENKQGYSQRLTELGLDPEKISISEATDGGNVTGFGIYEFSGDSIVIHCIEPQNDLVLFDGIARSVMFLAVLKGIEKAEYRGDTRKNAALLKFISDEKPYIQPISSIFNGCEGCRHNKNK